MMTFLLTCVSLALIALFIKSFILTSQQDQCFRRIWAMDAAGFNRDKDEIYDQLFSVYGLDFSMKRLKSSQLDTLMKDALEFDMKKNQNSRGIYVSPIVQREIKTRMKAVGKMSEFKAWSKKVKSKGAFVIEQIGV